MSYATRYLAALALLVAALAGLGYQFLLEMQVKGWPGVLVWAAALAAAILWLVLVHNKGLLLLKSCPLDYRLFQGLLFCALLLLGLLAWLQFPVLGGFAETTEQLAREWDEQVEALTAARGELAGAGAAEGEDDSGPGVWGRFAATGRAFLRAGQLLLVLTRLMVSVGALLARLAGVVLLVLLALSIAIVLLAAGLGLWTSDMKTGVLCLLAIPLLLAATTVVFPGDSAIMADYGPFGAVLLVLSLLLAVNWGSLGINGDVSRMHPVFYAALVELSRTPRVSRQTLRDHLGAAARSWDKAVPPEVIDRMEKRLLDERLVMASATEGELRVGLRKRLTTLDAGLGVVSLLYIIYPSLGVFEIVPDTLPLVGNLDEAFFVALLVGRIYPRWRADREEATSGLPVNEARSASPTLLPARGEGDEGETPEG